VRAHLDPSTTKVYLRREYNPKSVASSLPRTDAEFAGNAYAHSQARFVRQATGRRHAGCGSGYASYAVGYTRAIRVGFPTCPHQGPPQRRWHLETRSPQRGGGVELVGLRDRELLDRDSLHRRKSELDRPQVSYKTPPPVCHTIEMRRSIRTICTSAFAEAEYSSSWVGIGGYCENAGCTTVDNTLIQLGTEHDVSSRRAAQYYAWVEVLPNYPILISPSYPYCQSLSCAYAVDPGDAITASLSCKSNCSNPGQTQSWHLTMKNATKGWTFSTTVSYASTLLSAEWIQEAPSSSAGVLPLADFVTITFDPTVNASSAPNFPPGANGTVGPDAILMVDPYGETSAPSPAETGPIPSAFATCWGNNPNSIAGCPAP